MAGVLQSWWSLAARGVLAVFFGIAVLVYPSAAESVLILMFGVYALAQGLLTLFEAVKSSWWTRVLGGLVGVGVGVISFVLPQAVILVLIYFIAAWAIVTGILEVLAAISLRRYIEGELILALSGAAAIFFGILLIAFPATFLWLIGVFALVFGALQVIIAVRIRQFRLAHPV
jgi:uncharacterized membrane protein HdeD (DUF308 family)